MAADSPPKEGKGLSILMAKIVSDYTNYLPVGATVTLKVGAGKVHAIVAFGTTTTGTFVTFYDNTSASGNTLLVCCVSIYHPSIIIYPSHLALKFTVGLTVVTTAGSICHVVTEESE